MEEKKDRVADFLAYLAADRGYSAETIATYSRDLYHFEQYLGSLDEALDWNTVDADVVRRWMMECMSGGLGPRAMKRALSALRSFYKYLLRLEIVERDPMQLVQNPKAPKTLPCFVKETEMDRLLDGIVYPDNVEGLRDRTILLTFYTTGVRVSELVGLDRENVDLAIGELKVTGKRNKQRIIPFGMELSEALRQYMEATTTQINGGQGALFLDGKGRRLTVAKVREVVRHYLSLVTTQKRKTPHVLRHTFATVMLNHGADLEAVKELLGHESLATTEIYTHTSFAELKKEYEKAHPRGDS
ncbi:tyrosine recombinase XerC [gut metagenome]|uniref:Tyrosine recombinase XerC n=1 Tax=gut metagenome TaxID=749906 RepID=J9GXX4_9ZZZZ